MLSKNGQIVIGIAIVIISAAFLLVGIYFANVQGLLFQNGANSLQLFANNIAAARNALYIAPSSLSITLSGNNSLCSWNPSIDAYDCGGGAKIYNVSYASGPTLDAGTSTFSLALCFMLTVGPPGGAFGKSASAADTAAEEVDTLRETATSLESELGVESEEVISAKQAYRSAQQAFNQEFGPQKEAEAAEGLSALFDRADAGAGISDNPALAKAVDKFQEARLETGLVFSGIIEPTSYSELVLSYAGKAYSAFKKVQGYYNRFAAVRILGNNLGIPALIFWLSAGGAGDVSNAANQVYSDISSGFSVAGNAVSALPSDAQASASAAASSYLSGAPILGTNAAINIQLQQYSILASSASDFANSQSVDPQTYNDIQTIVGNAQLQQDIFNQLAQYAANLPAPTSISGFQGLEIRNAAVNSTTASFEIVNSLTETVNINNVALTSPITSSSFSCGVTQLSIGATTICNENKFSGTPSSNYKISVTITYTPILGTQTTSSGTISGTLESGDLQFLQSTASDPYGTPAAGISTPSTLTSGNAFAGNAQFNSPVDPLLSSASYLASKSFLVYAQTATCMGSMPQGISINNLVSDALATYGEATSPVDFYNKLNVITKIGTYFVGYGGEVYVNGQSNGIPTLSGAPVITDLSDLCSIATTTPNVAGNLATLVLPAGNGDISLSLNQGMYNTMCSSLSPLYPKTLSTVINQMLNSQSDSKISILLPPQFAISISNSSQSAKMCINRLLLDGTGTPIAAMLPISTTSSILGQALSGSQISALMQPNYLTEFGIPVSCINLTNLTQGRDNLIFRAHVFKSLNNLFNLQDNLNVNSFFLNNQSEIGFSIPPTDYPNPLTINTLESPSFQSTGNFIGGPTPIVNMTTGIDSPTANLVASLLGSDWQSKLSPVLNALKLSGNNVIAGYIVAALLNDIGNNNLSYYPTDYANVTFTVIRTTDNGVVNFNITGATDSLVFGVYPNNYNSLGGTYVQNPSANLFGYFGKLLGG